MPPQLDKTQLRSLSLRVASTWLKIAFSMDEYARLSMLEGFANEKPGKWVNKGRRGFGIAQDKFPGMHPNWASPRDTGVYRGALKAVEKVLRGAGVSGTGAEEVLQELNTHATKSTGPSYRRIFYTVGESNRKHGKDKDLDSGKLSPNDSSIGGTLNRWVSQKALNVVQTKHEKMETAYPTMGAPEDAMDPFRSVGTEALTEEDRMRLLLMAMKSRSSIGNRVRDFIDREIDLRWSTADAQIVRAFMSKISDPKWNTPPKGWRQRKGDPRSGAEAWFAAAVKKIGNEVMGELDVSRQRISNVIGGGARNLIKFMEKIGQKANVEALVEQFSNEIEYLEAGPGLNIRAGDDSMVDPLPIKQIPVDPHSIMQMWMEKRKDDAAAAAQESPMQRQFERNKEKNFDEQHSNDVHEGNPVACGECGDDEEEESPGIMADKEVSVGPLTFTIGPVPGASSGAMKFAAKHVAAAWLEAQR